MQYFHFLRCERNRAAVYFHFIVCYIDFKARHADHTLRLICRRTVTAKHSLYACNYFSGAKWFYYIVICSQLKPYYSINLLAFCGKYYYWHSAFRPYFPAYLSAVLFGHHKIQYNKVRFLCFIHLQGLLPIKCRTVGIPFVFDIYSQRFVNYRLIIANENMLCACHLNSPPMKTPRRSLCFILMKFIIGI